MRGFGKRHTLAMANPIHEIPEELQQKLSLQPIRNRRPGGLLSPTERTSSKGFCVFLFASVFAQCILSDSPGCNWRPGGLLFPTE